jgi:outer membrane protein
MGTARREVHLGVQLFPFAVIDVSEPMVQTTTRYSAIEWSRPVGCPDWPGCYGHVTPPSVKQSAAATAAYPNRPLEGGKAWREMVHRYAAGTLVCIINDEWLPDLDVEYFFTPHWSSELVLTYPQKQNVTLEHSALGGPTTIGTFKHLPPTLTAKYNFMPDQTFQPYLGAGVNVTSIMDVKLQVPSVGRLTLDRTSVGAAVQGGFDYRIAKSWYFNVDAKWLMLRSDVKLGDVKISRARIDPVLLGVGFGYRFGGGS